MKVVYWICRVVAAVILLQTLYFKFGGAAESIYIFETVHMEPWGRYGTGVVELVASVLLLINSTVWLGSILALGLMVGAIGMHLTILGIEVQGDGGQLFLYAVIVTVCSLFALFYDREKISEVIASLTRK